MFNFRMVDKTVKKDSIANVNVNITENFLENTILIAERKRERWSFFEQVKT